MDLEMMMMVYCKKLKKQKRKEQKERAKRVWKGMTGGFSYRGRHGRRSVTDEDEDETVVLDDDGDTEDPKERRASHADSRTARIALNSPSSQISPTSSASSATTMSLRTSFMNSRAGRFLHKWYGILHLAHLTAARKQAVERAERINQVYKREEGVNSSGGADVVGWGLGSYGLREMEREPRCERGMSSDVNDDGYDKAPTTHVERDPQQEVRRHDRTIDLVPEPAPAVEAGLVAEPQRTSMWWWGPLQRWRLQDASVYS